jgi:signal transduction histidine kinase
MLAAPSSLGSATLLTLLAAALLSPLPSQPWVALLMGLAALWLERGGLDLDQGRRHRFSPAVPLYLAMPLAGGVGGAAAALFLAVDALHRMDRGVMSNLRQRLPLALAVLAGSAAAAVTSSAGRLAVAPVSYLLFTWAWRRGLTAATQEDRTVQRQLQYRIGPLELALAAVSPLLATIAQQTPVLLVLLLPLLACSHLAAENALLTAHDETIAGMLEKLRGAQARAAQISRQRDQALQEKQILEGFARQLAGQPELGSVATNLMATVERVMPVDSVVVFLGTPPEPFCYRTTDSQLTALQGAALTALREPLVDRAFRQRKPVLQRKAPQVAERLLPEDQVAAALPLGHAGVLYAGRRSETAFTPAELERLKWLAGKATIALEAAFQSHEEARRRRLQEQTVHLLEQKVAWLSQLVQGAEAMASTLDGEVLVHRFTAALGQTVPHDGGQLLLAERAPASWGMPLAAAAELLETARGMGRPLVIEDTASSRFGSPAAGASSLVAVPLLAGQECLGTLLLASQRKSAFSSQQVDLLFLLCSQAAMALSHAELYRQVVEARRQLEESQASLVQSSKLTAIGQLAAGVAHELNSPLGAISLSVGEALHQLDQQPELSRRFLTRAHTAVGKAREIVDRLMAYSRKADGQAERLSLESLVRDTLEFLTFQLRSAGVSVQLASVPETTVEGVPQPLQQVVTNLVLNAVQAMDEQAGDSRRLTVELFTPEGMVELRVRDSGTGIAPEHLPRIFDPFFTTKPVGRGTGLGLWACQQIVSQHHGTIAVDSQPGQGTTFTVRLPAAPARDTSTDLP